MIRASVMSAGIPVIDEVGFSKRTMWLLSFRAIQTLIPQTVAAIKNNINSMVISDY